MGTGLSLAGFTCQQTSIQSVTAHQKFAVLVMGQELFGEMMKLNREVIFRGFHHCDGPDIIVVNGEKVKGRWVEGYYVERDNKSWIYPASNQMISKSLARELRPFHSAKSTQKIMKEVFPVLPSTVGQYINVDCFGTKVFEHDVIAVEDDQGEIYRFCVSFGECGGTKNVKHKVGYMGFHFKPQNEETKVFMEYGARDDILYWLNSYNCEVIGTVFEEVMP